MAFSGSSTVLSGDGPVVKSTFRSTFILPVIADIEALQGGSAITMAGLSADPALASTSRIMTRTAGATYYTTINDIALKVPGITGTWITAVVLGLAGDGITDDAPALQRGFDTYAGTGAVFYLKSVHSNNQFLLRGRVRQPSGITVICASPFLLKADGGYDIRGERAWYANRDAFRIGSAISAAATTISIDTAPYGGGAVSTFFSVGDQIEIWGKLDSAGSPQVAQREVVRVTSVTDPATLGVTATQYAYSVSYASDEYQAAWGLVNRTLIKRIAQARLASDAAVGDNVLTINSSDIGNLAVGDDVIVEDNKIASDYLGTGTGRLHRECARIAAAISGDTSSKLRLGHRLEHDISTAYAGRITKLNVVRNSSLSGATFLFGEAPTLSPNPIKHPFRMTFATECSVNECVIPNTDSYGTRGCFRFEVSRGCVGSNLNVRSPKYVGADEGLGIHLAYCKGVNIEGGYFDGVRNAVTIDGSSGCLVRSPVISNTVAEAFHFSGLEETGCIIFDAQGEGGVQWPGGDGRNPSVVNFGSTNLGAVRFCGMIGGRFRGYRAEDGVNHNPVVRFLPGASRCFIDGTQFDDIGALLYHVDTPDYGAVVATDCALLDVRVNGCVGYLAEVDGRANGAGIDTLNGMLIDGMVVTGATKGFKLARATGVTIRDCTLTEVTTSAGAPYVITADTVTDLCVDDNRFDGWLRGISLSSCGNTWRVLENDFGTLGEYVILNDVGGNDGGLWSDNVAQGTPNANLRSLRAGGSAFKEFPRLAGPVSLADDATLTLTPPRSVGMGYVQENEDVNIFARLIYFTVAPSGTPGLQYSDETSNMAFTAGDISAGGTDGKFNVSVYGGNLQLRNRLGSTIVVDFAYL